ncbi:MAG: hypothetical protein L6Q95_12820 [Planctomycetes bacterium]|nr:hypothetical protein [Planctomycetota bacterium]
MRRVLWLAILAALVRGEDPAPTPEAINRAIDAGVLWLKSAQLEDGSYGPCMAGGAYDGTAGGVCYRLGPTAFSLFTLAVCGVPKEDPAIQRGLTWLRKTATRDYEYASYESAALVLMLTALNGVDAPKGKLVRSSGHRRPPEGSRFPAEEWRWMDECMQLLRGCVNAGGFGYWPEEEGYADVSATQFAALALRSASFAGYPVPREDWLDIVDFHAKLQDPSGGFPYQARSKPSRGMTAAALSTLFICREQLALEGLKEPPSLAPSIERGMRHLDSVFDVETNPSPHFEGRDHYHYAHLYAIERAGILSGRREFGGKGWYPRGAAFLLRAQDRKGRWTDGTCMGPEDVLGTCFALLFLKKATIPAVTRK